MLMVYSLLIARMKPVGIGQGSEFGGGLLRSGKENTLSAFMQTGRASRISRSHDGRTRGLNQRMGPEPKLIDFIPGKDLGLVDRSVRYLKSHVLLNQRFFIAHQNILN